MIKKEPSLVRGYDSRVVRQRILTSLAAGLLILQLSACNSRESKTNLGNRIRAANTTQYCRGHETCYNPHILAVESGYVLTTFKDSRPQYSQTRAADLADRLLELPMSAWPNGPVVTISPSDDVLDPAVVKQNFAAAQVLCRSMGLEVQVRRGG